jgi:hypothetical protein
VAAQRTRFVVELGVGRVAGRHGVGVQAGKGRVELLEGGLIGVHGVSPLGAELFADFIPLRAFGPSPRRLEAEQRQRNLAALDELKSLLTPGFHWCA